MCGEHRTAASVMPSLQGSSPHVRGTPVRPLSSVTRRGIIPACAGNTGFLFCWCWIRRDHPRMCGEHDEPHEHVVGVLGSSPHVRGTLYVVCRFGANHGIIPACAGNTQSSQSWSSPTWDHPRMCGEHFICSSIWRSAPGSSPHVRGTPRSLGTIVGLSGIIPACAGNTPFFIGLMRQPWDHPRMCGEHWRSLSVYELVMGSSPHVRGTPKGDNHGFHPEGIIPACAGNTANKLADRWGLRDHPRMCGEHAKATIIRGDSKGSSPHVRGTPAVPDEQGETRGIIPACAGNTRS